MYIGDVKTLMITLTTLCLCVYTATAQDTLLLLNGDDLYVKVEKIDGATISYTIPPDTTLFTLNKEEVFMVKFANGTRYTLTKTQTKEESKRQLEDAAKKKQALESYEKYNGIYNRKKTTGIVLVSIGSAVAATGISLAVYYRKEMDKPYSNTAQLLGMMGGIVLSAASSPFLIIGIKNLADLPKYKRLANGASAALSLAPSVTPANSVVGTQTGLAMRITF